MRALLPFLFLSAAAAAVQPAFDHADWTLLLQRYVDDDGRVAYRDLAATDRPTLDRYLAALAAAEPGAWPRDEQIAFWLNAYNAVIVAAILDGQSAESLFGRYSIFFRYTRRVAGKARTPDEIENAIVRRFGESRIHFALVCASASCPKLRRRAWQGESLDRDLDEEARRFIRDPTRNDLRPGAEEIRLSAIFDWYGDDFGGNDDALRAYLARYVDEPERRALQERRPEIDYLDYDWTMNAQSGQRPSPP